MIVDFVPYEESLELKKLDYNDSVSTYYSYPDKELLHTMDGHGMVSYRRNSQFGHAVSAPTFSQAFRWFREKHKLIGHVRESWSFDNTMEYVAQINGTFVNHGLFDKPVNRFDTYEEAELACLKKLIEIVKTK